MEEPEADVVMLSTGWHIIHTRVMTSCVCLLLIAQLVLIVIVKPASAPPPPPDIYHRTYAIEGSFMEPIVGPSSPMGPYRDDGRLWIVIAHDTGLLEMDSVASQNSTFDNPTPAKTLRIQSYGLQTPLSNMIYLAPGRNTLGQYEPNDDLSRNGLLGFVAAGHLILIDPFDGEVLLDRDLGFQPRWFAQDVVSAGEMYDFPFLLNLHCYRFIVAANDTHLTVYRVDYRSSQDPLPVKGADKLIDVDMPVTGMPLAYNLQLQDWGSGIFVPTAGNKLAAFSIDGQNRSDIPLSLGGEPANISAPIGFIRAPESRMLYVPLKSATKTGVAYLKPMDVPSGDLPVTHTLIIEDSSKKVTAQPDPANSWTPFFVVTEYTGDVPMNSQILRGIENGSLDQSVNIQLSSPVRDFFYSATTSQVMALDENGKLWQALLEDGWSASEFPLEIQPSGTRLIYAGASTGSKYGVFASSNEMVGLLFEHGSGKATIFLLATQLTPPPGDGDNGGTASSQWIGVLVIVLAVTAVIIAVLVAITIAAMSRPRQGPPRYR